MTEARRRAALLVALGVSAVGDSVLLGALVVRFVEEEAAFALGVVATARVVGLLLGSVAVAGLPDRLDRGVTARTCDVARAAVLVGLLVVGPAPAALVAVSFLLGVGEAVFRPSVMSLVPSIVPPEALASTNAWVGGLTRGVLVACPVVGVTAYRAFGLETVVALDAVSFLGSWALLRRATRDLVTSAPGNAQPLRERWLDGLAVCRSMPWIGRSLLTAALQVALVTAPMTVVLPVAVEEGYGDVGRYAVLTGAAGVGAMAAALAVRAVQPWLHLALGGTTVFAVALVTVAGRAPFAMAVAAFVLSGAALEMFVVYWTTAVQRAVPDTARLGRVFALDQAVNLVLTPVGTMMGGALVGWIGGSPLLLGCACAQVAALAPLASAPTRSAFRRAFAVPEPTHVATDGDSADPALVAGAH